MRVLAKGKESYTIQGKERQATLTICVWEGTMRKRIPPLFALISFMVLLTTSLIAQGEVKREVVDLEAEDGRRQWALFYSDGTPNPSTGVMIMHPRGDSRRNWRLPYFARAGIVGLGMASRHERAEEDERYEDILLDLAAGVRYLRNEVGVRKVILLGHSGGGSLMTFYAHQSAKKPGERFSSTFTGHGPDLNKFDLPPVDLLVISAAHFGNAFTFTRKIDPSLTDEDDPTSLDPSLDMYNPANGFRIPPEPSKYSKEFLERFEKGQQARRQRVVDKALAIFRERQSYEKFMQSPVFGKLDRYEQIQIQRKAIANHYLVIYRLLAIPEFTDLSLNPDDRVVGSNGSNRPDWANYDRPSHPNVMRVDAFLDTYSPYSHVDLLKQIKEVRVPTLFITGSADMQEYPSEREAMYEASAGKVKKLVWIEGGNHGYLPKGPKAGDGKQRDRAMEEILAFIDEYLE